MARLVYDLETDGLLETVSKIHCLVTRDVDTGVVRAYYEAGCAWCEFHETCSVCGFTVEHPPAGSIRDGLAALLDATVRIGHYIQGYDEAVLAKFFPDFRRDFDAERVYDTKIAAAVIWPDEHLKSDDHIRKALGKNKLPGNLFGRHSLEAWGHRLRVEKGDFGKQTDWKTLSPEMLRYCVQDTRVTAELFKMLETRRERGMFSMLALSIESEFAWHIQQQQLNGFPFDVASAERLVGTLSSRRAELLDKMGKDVPPFVDTKTWVTKVRKERKSKVVTTLFNPGSRVHVARHLIERKDWKPVEFTPTGDPQVTEEVISKLRIDGIDDIREYFKVQKILGMVAEGDSAWTKLVKPDGRIHGYCGHNSAVTHRCTHSKPNVSQVPRVGKVEGWRGGFGVECRRLFTPRPGWVLVGGDASGLELRMLAHYFAKYDDGEYAKVVVDGDVHTANMKAAGLDDRSIAKNMIYALLYGAGDAKLAKTMKCSTAKAKAARHTLLKNTPALAKLIHAVRVAAARNKKLKLPDGRFVNVRSEYAALNSLLQATGAIVMKVAVNLFHRDMERKGYTNGIDYEQHSQSHDEVQVGCRPEIADEVAGIFRNAVADAGGCLNIRCPLAGTAKAGTNWAETH
jgi:DNA polymerase I-like protein with 3'-5' exonuclease and polymerase domains